tara:strand:+ start:539 stop:664 length:126 start_codon:yes stop_codon:yes gene_type:complete
LIFIYSGGDAVIFIGRCYGKKLKGSEARDDLLLGMLDFGDG